jgi:Zn-dependent peptidase ImmA (M78 family)
MLLLGGGVTDDTFYRSTLSNAQEAEANRFAADVLMPYPLIQRLIASGTSSVSQLANALQVSEAAMKIRLGIPIP